MKVPKERECEAPSLLDCNDVVVEDGHVRGSHRCACVYKLILWSSERLRRLSKKASTLL